MATQIQKRFNLKPWVFFRGRIPTKNFRYLIFYLFLAKALTAFFNSNHILPISISRVLMPIDFQEAI